MDKKEKKKIFEDAKKASSQLIFWNIPEKKKQLSELNKREIEFRLWKDNKLDALILKKLGDGGWDNYKETKLNDTDFNFLKSYTQELNIFFDTLK